MASKETPPESVPPSVVEIATFGKMLEMMNSFKKTHVFKTAVELGVFAAVHGSEARTAQEIARQCDIHDSQKLDTLLDVLVAENFLRRHQRTTGNDADTKITVYENCEGTDLLLGDPSAPTHMSAISMLLKETETEMKSWSHLTDVLKTGAATRATPTKAVDEVTSSLANEEDTPKKRNCHDVDDDGVTASAEEVEEWSDLYAMFEGYMRIAFNVLADKFDFSKFSRVLDIGGGTAQLSRILCRRYKNLSSTNLDLPRTVAIAEKRMAAIGGDVADRIKLVGGNCFEDDLPTPVDVVIIANVMHGFDNDDLRKLLVKKAHAALSPGGVFIVIEDIINTGQLNESALFWQMSMDVTRACSDHGHRHQHAMLTDVGLKSWCEAVGFRCDTEPISLVGSMQAAVAVKP